jgi:hypothetical protein
VSSLGRDFFKPSAWNFENPHHFPRVESRQDLAVRRTRKKVDTEIFVCDGCASRKRLASNQRHWCDVCTFGVPVEMRCVKDKWQRPRDDSPNPLSSRF